ncbi:MAG: hypothetical protein ACOYMG_02225 [Candidatus Methylumidiphilus sp.]
MVSSPLQGNIPAGRARPSASLGEQPRPAYRLKRLELVKVDAGQLLQHSDHEITVAAVGQHRQAD